MTTHEVVLPLFSPMSSLPEKRYRTVVADPPWRIQTMGFTKMGFKPELPYPTMTQEQLLNMPVGLWAEEKSHLYLWTTNSKLGDALELAKVWGFKFNTLITWIKRHPPHYEDRDDYSDDHYLGLGRYYRTTTEHIVFAVRGGMDVLHKDQPNFFHAPRGQHSEKPAAFYDMVERMSPGPYLDVFARKQRFRWDTFGNESFDFRDHGHFNADAPAVLDGNLSRRLSGSRPVSPSDARPSGGT